MVCRAQFAVGHPRAHATENDREVRVDDIGLDLLERAPGEEGRGRTYEGPQARVGQACRDAHHVLLGDADVDESIRKRLAECTQVA